MLTLSSCLQDMPLLAGEPLGPSPAAEEPLGRAVVMRGTRMLLGRCPVAPRVLRHGGGPFPAAPPLLGASTTHRPQGWCHFSSFPLAAPHCSATINYFWMCQICQAGAGVCGCFPPPHGASGSRHPVLRVGAALLPSQPALLPHPQRMEAAGGQPVLMPGLLSPTALLPALP